MKFLLQSIVNFHFYCSDKNLMKTSACESLNDKTGNENTASEAQIDEELISIVQQRSACMIIVYHFKKKLN